ncbi:hypothetical protein OZX73_05345 [Bifidobacterium sp. ESL0775]|uniref:hypothetical protein n=1 Tax=Bifidobacterium sp. ESL0775 TaxID=2983230 RepID=UPI0023F94C7C|nr:hypothetical protein [Bifidobacterium sp. ESL0775]WEV68717.1 hypothetical protein OZX73_05345 [Bifidobacterium sp. ESL0775]
MEKNNTIPAGLDFDNATEEQLEQGIKDAGRQLENKYIVKYPNLYIRTISGNTYKMALAIPGNYFDDIDDDLSPLDQIIRMLEKENPGKKKAIRAELNASLLAIASKYGDVVENVQMATLGKYEPSGSKSNQTAQK